jgi:hypothetical protein
MAGAGAAGVVGAAGAGVVAGMAEVGAMDMAITGLAASLAGASRDVGLLVVDTQVAGLQGADSMVARYTAAAVDSTVEAGSTAVAVGADNNPLASQ